MVDTYANVSNRRIGYTDVGEGPAVLLLHGDTLDRRFWSPIIDDLSRDHRVIAPDTRGHGRSPDTRGPFSYEDFADDWRILIDVLELESVAVVGHSGGACTALLMGLTYPELIRGMVLAGCPFNISAYPAGTIEWMETASLDEFRSWAGEWADLAIAEYGSLEDYTVFWNRMFHDLFTREPNLTPRELRKITPRVLVLHAEKEESFDLAHSEELATTLANAELLVVPSATHMTLVSADPAGTSASILRFLRELETTDA